MIARPFRRGASERKLVSREADDGTIMHFFHSDAPIVAWQRVPLKEGLSTQIPLFVLPIGTIALALLAPILGCISRRGYDVESRNVLGWKY